MKFVALILLFVSLNCSAKILNVPRVRQENDTWCWLASSEMVNKYHGVCSVDKDPNMQCSMIRYMSFAGLLPEFCMLDCRLCSVSAQKLENLRYPLDSYSKDAAKNCGNAVKTDLKHRPSTLLRLKYEIDNNMPILAGVNPSLRGQISSEPEHLIVVVGYTGNNDNPILRVNDPFDYPPYFNPYLKIGAKNVGEGVYDIYYKDLLSKFAWQTTAYIRKVK